MSKLGVNMQKITKLTTNLIKKIIKEENQKIDHDLKESLALEKTKYLKKLKILKRISILESKSNKKNKLINEMKQKLIKSLKR